jgi:hypothetical protein
MPRARVIKVLVKTGFYAKKEVFCQIRFVLDEVCLFSLFTDDKSYEWPPRKQRSTPLFLKPHLNGILPQHLRFSANN